MALFDRITIIGLGLIGASIARAVKENGLAHTIVGCDQSDVALNYARANKFIDVAMNDAATAVSGSDLVILATPPSSMGDVVKDIAGSLKHDAILMDTASVKEPVMQAISLHLPSHVDFIPAHPIAGSEQSGVSAGRADLFDGKRVIVTPNEPLQPGMLKTVTAFWSAMGARVEGVPPQLHDMIYAHVSHLPQLLAFAAAPIVNAPEEKDGVLGKFLRLGGSNPALWTEIFSLNRDNIISALDRYLDALWHIKGELSRAPEEEKSGNDDALARRVLFPRIAASCLITTLMEAEKKAGFSFARFAGTGFADFTAPVTGEPDEDIERISQHYLAVLNVVQDYILALKSLRELIAEDEQEALKKAL